MIETRNLRKYFGGVKAVDDVSMKIPKGKITALIGPNGSGKTTFFNLISGIIKADKGRIILDKEDISLLKDFERSKKGISRTFQKVKLFENLTIEENFLIALENDLKIVKKIFSKNQDFSKKIKNILNKFDIDKNISTEVKNLSYGQRKLLDIGIGFAKPHKILLLDEPVSGVNPKIRKKIKDIFLDLKEKGETIVVIEHNMEFVMGIADKVICLQEGKIIFEGKPQDAQKSKKVLEAYLGK